MSPGVRTAWRAVSESRLPVRRGRSGKARPHEYGWPQQLAVRLRCRAVYRLRRGFCCGRHVGMEPVPVKRSEVQALRIADAYSRGMEDAMDHAHYHGEGGGEYRGPADACPLCEPEPVVLPKRVLPT